MHMIHEVQRSISALVLGGVLESSRECRSSARSASSAWLPHWMQRMDHANRSSAP